MAMAPISSFSFSIGTIRRVRAASDFSDWFIRIFHRDICNVDDLLPIGGLIQETCRATWRNRIALLFGGPSQRRIVQRDMS